MTQLLDYEKIRLIALENEISDNKVSIGMFAKLNGYLKTIKRENGKQKVYYLKPN